VTSTARTEVRTRRRAARRAESTIQILDAAEKVFAEDGLRDGSLRRIADLSGYSTAAIYRFFDSKQHLVAETLNRGVDEYLSEVRQAAIGSGTALERLHRIVDSAAVFFVNRGNFKSLLRQGQGGSAIVGPVLATFADDVYGRYAQVMAVMTDLIRDGQQSAEIRDGDAGALAHLASVLVNEYVLAELALEPQEFHAVFDGALRATP
jgi:AcrR family transcriptional regulator